MKTNIENETAEGYDYDTNPFPQKEDLGLKETKVQTQPADRSSLTCERCGNKTDGGAWLGFVYVGAECLTESDNEYLE